jgi:hypothetical protein
VPCVLWSELYRVLVQHAVSKPYEVDVILRSAYSQVRVDGGVSRGVCCATSCRACCCSRLLAGGVQVHRAVHTLYCP